MAGAAVFCAASLRAAAPEFPAHPNEVDVPRTVPVGKTLVVPLACDDADGDILSYTVVSSNPHVFARVKTGNPQLKVHVHSDNDGSGSPLDGDMEFSLFRDYAPETVSFIGGYAQAGYYDNVIFHRIVPNFVIQGGDPAGTGDGRAYQLDADGRFVLNNGQKVLLQNYNLSYSLANEFRTELIFSGRGQLAMANAGYGGNFVASGNSRYQTASYIPTNGTQFFITLGELRDFNGGVNLDYKHTIFGQLVRGFDIMDKCAALPTITRETSTDSASPDFNKPAYDNRPVPDLKMTALSVAPSKTDGILLISATAPGNCTITVTAKDKDNNTTTKDYAVTVVADTINDPPIIDPIDPIVMPLGGTPNFRVRTLDLESDAVSTRFPVFDTTQNQVIYAGLNADNLRAVARPTIGAWDVTISASGLNDPLTNASPFDASRFQLLEIGVGDRSIALTPVSVEATAGVTTGTVRLATFRHGGVGVDGADFTATVAWGDGSNSQSSSGNSAPITVVRSPANPSYYEVRGAHTYAKAGVYPLKVILDGPLGAAAKVTSDVVVSASNATLKAVGDDLEFNASPLYSGRPVATFTDSTPGVKIANFSTTIDWGDGQKVPGGIRQIGAGKFAVYGSHRYLDPGRHSVAVYVHRETPTVADAVAWTSITMGGFPGPAQLPPFAKANITSYWSGAPTKMYRGNAVDINGTLFIINGGQKPTTKWSIRMWLSSDTTLNTTGPNADTLLKIGPLTKLVTEVPLNALPPGGGGNFGFQNSGANADFTIRLPAGETGAGKYVIAQLVYNDPISDNMAVRKAIPFGPLNGILVTSPDFNGNSFITVKEGAAGAPQKTATFHVRLDTQPSTPTVGIASIVAGATTTINTTGPHGFTTGKEVLISGVAGATPSINGVFTATVVDEDTFTIPVNTTLTGTGGLVQLNPAVKIPLEIVNNTTGAVDSSRATLDQAQLIFSPGTATIDQVVTVTSVDDSTKNGTGGFTIRLKAAVSNDPRFNGMVGDQVTLLVLDND